MKRTICFLLVLSVCLAAEGSAELDIQYDVLLANLVKRDHIAGWADQTYHESALIDVSDRDPADIVLRRTRVLLNDILLYGHRQPEICV